MWVGGRLVVALLAVGWSASVLAGSARVTFVNLEKFTDIGRYADGREAAANSTEIARHIEQLAARKLPADQLLEVDVLDVALAGRWPVPPRDVRVMRSVNWPSIKVRYRLKRGEQVLAGGEETVADMDYLQRLNPYPTGDPLRYEKQMLDEWFQQRLVALKPEVR